jgi:hypothetical protein
MKALLYIGIDVFICWTFPDWQKCYSIPEKGKIGTVYHTMIPRSRSINGVKATFKADDFSHYKASYDELLKDTVVRLKHLIWGNTQKWSPIYRIKGKYYLYVSID